VSASDSTLNRVDLRARTTDILTGNPIAVTIGTTIASTPHLNGFFASTRRFAASALRHQDFFDALYTHWSCAFFQTSYSSSRA
jgi:hypothetical protein